MVVAEVVATENGDRNGSGKCSGVTENGSDRNVGVGKW